MLITLHNADYEKNGGDGYDDNYGHDNWGYVCHIVSSFAAFLNIASWSDMFLLNNMRAPALVSVVD
jgi:hypothetical protein